ncbi:hypothetical protein Vi05172_g10140 [Venturia inaequalis]|nr:hypothetical protein Vi05172_g10140 [Venturia inaequalis]
MIARRSEKQGHSKSEQDESRRYQHNAQWNNRNGSNLAEIVGSLEGSISSWTSETHVGSSIQPANLSHNTVSGNVKEIYANEVNSGVGIALIARDHQS